jgi:multicomponent Na+:H+ antiporter subunit C
MTLGTLPYVLTLFLVLIGLYVIVAKKNMIKIILGVAIMGYAINLFLVLLGYRTGGMPPIRTPDQTDTAAFAAGAVDPLPQAMILTAIVIGLGVLALMVSLAIRLYEKYRTFDMTRIRELKG